MRGPCARMGSTRTGPTKGHNRRPRRRPRSNGNRRGATTGDGAHGGWPGLAAARALHRSHLGAPVRVGRRAAPNGVGRAGSAVDALPHGGHQRGGAPIFQLTYAGAASGLMALICENDKCGFMWRFGAAWFSDAGLALQMNTMGANPATTRVTSGLYTEIPLHPGSGIGPPSRGYGPPPDGRQTQAAVAHRDEGLPGRPRTVRCRGPYSPPVCRRPQRGRQHRARRATRRTTPPSWRDRDGGRPPPRATARDRLRHRRGLTAGVDPDD